MSLRCTIGLHDWREAGRYLATRDHPSILVLECCRPGCRATRIPR